MNHSAAVKAFQGNINPVPSVAEPKSRFKAFGHSREQGVRQASRTVLSVRAVRGEVPLTRCAQARAAATKPGWHLDRRGVCLFSENVYCISIQRCWQQLRTRNMIISRHGSLLGDGHHQLGSHSHGAKWQCFRQLLSVMICWLETWASASVAPCSSFVYLTAAQQQLLQGWGAATLSEQLAGTKQLSMLKAVHPSRWNFLGSCGVGSCCDCSPAVCSACWVSLCRRQRRLTAQQQTWISQPSSQS